MAPTVSANATLAPAQGAVAERAAGPSAAVGAGDDAMQGHEHPAPRGDGHARDVLQDGEQQKKEEEEEEEGWEDITEVHEGSLDGQPVGPTQSLKAPAVFFF